MYTGKYFWLFVRPIDISISQFVKVKHYMRYALNELVLPTKVTSFLNSSLSNSWSGSRASC